MIFQRENIKMNKLGTVFTKIAMKREKGKGCTAAVFHGLDVRVG